MIDSVSGSYSALVTRDQSERRWQFSLPAPRKVDNQADARRAQSSGLPDRVGPEGEQVRQSESSDRPHQYRVEVRLQAQAAKLGADDAAVLPRQKLQALQTYGEVANTRQEPGVELVGLYLKV